ncbi:MAG: protease complex subunit PrcB family protein [Gaiellaceae bacterium]
MLLRSASQATPGSRPARVAILVGLIAFAGIWVVWRQAFGHDRVRSLPWNDLTAEVAPLEFERGTTLRVSGPRTLALSLRAHGARRPPPRVDFAHLDVILVASGPRSATGYDLRVVSVVEQRSRVLVTLRERTPALRERVRPRLTFPFRLITIPKTGKPLHLHVQGRP